MVTAEDFFVFSPCRTEGSYQAVLRKQASIDLKALLSRLHAKGFDVVMSDDYLLVMYEEHYFSVFPNGKVLSRGAPTQDTFKKFALLVYQLSLK